MQMGKQRIRVMRRTSPWLLPCVVGFISFIAYIRTLPTAVGFEDSGEFVATAATFGVPHPSGYPLHVILGRLFVALPLGTIPWRVALLSAVCAAIAVALLAVSARAILQNMGIRAKAVHQTIIGIVALQFAFSSIWWTQAITPEVYALHVALLLAAFLCFVRWTVTRRRPLGIWAGIFVGLAMTDHLYLTLPVALVFLVIAIFLSEGNPWKAAGKAVAIPCLVASVIYVGFATVPRGPHVFAMGDISDLRGLIEHVFRLRYADVGTGGFNKLALVIAYFWRLLVDLGPLVAGLGLGTVGWILLVRDRRMLPSATVAVGAIVAVPAIIMVRSLSWSPVVEYVYSAYSTMGAAFLAVLAAVGAGALIERSSRVRRMTSGILLMVALAVIPIASAWANLPDVIVQSDPFPERYVTAVLQSLPEGAVFVVNDYGLEGDTELFILAYLQTVVGFRPDVTVVQDAGIYPFFTPELPHDYKKNPLEVRRSLLLEAAATAFAGSGRPLVASFPIDDPEKGWTSHATGYVYLVATDGAGESQPDTTIDLPDQISAERHTAMRALVAHAAYAKAALFMEQGRDDEATEALLLAIALDLTPLSTDYRAFIAHRAAILGDVPRGE